MPASLLVLALALALAPVPPGDCGQLARFTLIPLQLLRGPGIIDRIFTFILTPLALALTLVRDSASSAIIAPPCISPLPKQTQTRNAFMLSPLRSSKSFSHRKNVAGLLALPKHSVVV